MAPQSSNLTQTQHTRYSPAGRSYLPVKPQQCHTDLFTDVEQQKTLIRNGFNVTAFSAESACQEQCLTWERMLVHCCSKDTGGFPRLVASWTLSSCSFWVRLSCRAWAKATAAHQLDKESAEKRPPHSSCPAEMEFAVRKESKKNYHIDWLGHFNWVHWDKNTTRQLFYQRIFLLIIKYTFSIYNCAVFKL